MYLTESNKYSLGGSATHGASALLGDTLLSTIPMPLMNTPSNIPTSLANYMIANLMAEHARIFQQGQYSVTSRPMNYFQPDASLSSMSGVSSHIQKMTTSQITSIPTMTQDDTKSRLINEPPKLTELLNQELKISSNVSDRAVSMNDSRALTRCNLISKLGNKNDK